MLFADFVGYLEQLEVVSSRTELTKILASLYKQLDSTEIDKALYLILGRVSPKYDPQEFNFSVKLIVRVLELFNEFPMFGGANASNPEDIYKRTGDVGLTVEEVIRENVVNPSQLTLSEVFGVLKEVVETGGTGSQGFKTDKVYALFKKFTPDEGKYVARIMVGKLRLGVNEKTLLDALSWYLVGDKSIRDDLDRAFGVRADIGAIGSVVLSSTIENVSKNLNLIQLVPGTPVASKLVEREKSTQGIFARMDKCIIQPKLDGLRIQLHKWTKDGNSVVALFSRNQENMTEMFPELVNAMNKIYVDSIILDSEVIGFNESDGTYKSFQETITRKRKYNVDEKTSEVPVRAEIFDVLFLNGADLTQLPTSKRLEILRESFSKIQSPNLQMLDTKIVENEEDMEAYYQGAINRGLEGIIAKSLESKYEAGTRNFDWIKLKASAMENMVDTVDAVVMGYYLGTGKRNKFGIGAFLIGLLDPKDFKYKTIAKVGTGITDEELGIIKNDLDLLETAKPDNYEVIKSLEPDIYVKPQIVVEVEADQITRSNMHTASMDQEGKGLSLRFPRLIKWNRVDKDIENADTTDNLTKMFNQNNSTT